MRKFFRGMWEIVIEARADNITGEAAKVAYYLFLSLWPLLLGLFALTGVFGGEATFETIMAWIRGVLPGEATSLLRNYVHQITMEERPDMLSLGILLTMWAGSNIFASLIDGLNVMYDIEEARPWWKRRLLALVLLVCGSVLLTIGTAAILSGVELVDELGLGRLYAFLRYPLAFLALLALLWLVYYTLPARDQALSKRYVTTGAVVGATLWLVVTALFHLYVANFGRYETYGIVGAAIVLLLWLYLTAVAILLGGEVAVSLEQGIHRRHLERQALRGTRAPAAAGVGRSIDA